MIATITASALGRIEKCNASALLPQTTGSRNAWTDAGSARHAFLEAVPKVGREAALAAVPEAHRASCAILNLERLPVDAKEYAAEVAYAMNWRTGEVRELGRGLARDYGELDPDEIPGTCDVEGLTATHVILLDFKGAHAKLDDPSDSMQMLFLAYCASRLRNRDAAFVGHVRLRDDGEPWYFVEELGPMKLDAIEMRIRSLMLRLEALKTLKDSGAQVNVVEGDHCGRCNAFHSCPAKTRLARAIAYGEVVEKGFNLEGFPTLTNDDAVKVIERLKAIDEVSARVWKAVKELAKLEAIRMPDGKVYGKVEVTTETVDPAEGGRILAAEFGPDIADAATEIKQTMTWAAIDRALRPLLERDPGKDAEGQPLPKNRIGKLNEKAEKLLRDGGALKTSTHVEVKMFKPKALKP